ncbi:MAG: hypothetical protein GWN58_07385 [Anaerolineae bacterium]|nr:hypothetical protein [Anaerolineae bacterium]
MLVKREITIAIRPDQSGQDLEQMLGQPLGEDNERAALERLVAQAIASALESHQRPRPETVEVTIAMGWWQEQADELGM